MDIYVLLVVYLVLCVCRLELLRAERENAMFPDEIDTPQDVSARVRFQKYLSILSMFN